MESAVNRHVFYISDGTAITAEVLGHAVMSQFPVAIRQFYAPFVENISRAAVKEQIDAHLSADRHPPAGVLLHRYPTKKFAISFCKVRGFVRDIVQALVAPLQQELRLDRRRSRTHGLTPGNLNKYDARIAAIDYTLAHDDGISLRNLDQAQVILLGVSRAAKPDQSLQRCNTVSARQTTRLSPTIWTT